MDSEGSETSESLAREAEDIRDVEERLLRTFGATVGTDTVRRCVESAYAHYAHIRVRTYVVLLTERRAARDLRTLRQAQSHIA